MTHFFFYLWFAFIVALTILSVLQFSYAVRPRRVWETLDEALRRKHALVAIHLSRYLSYGAVIGAVAAMFMGNVFAVVCFLVGAQGAWSSIERFKEFAGESEA